MSVTPNKEITTMATIKPFRGIRPPKQYVEKIESYPYDVLSSEEARKAAEGNEMSFYHINMPEINFPEGTASNDPRVYESANQQFKKFMDKGWLIQDPEEYYYLYAQTMNNKTQYGILVGASADDYHKGIIKRHELTRREKEDDRMKHILVTDANMGPAFSLILTTRCSMKSSAAMPRQRLNMTLSLLKMDSATNCGLSKIRLI